MDDTVSDETNRSLVQISDLHHIVKSHRTANINYLSQVIPSLLPDSLKALSQRCFVNGII